MQEFETIKQARAIVTAVVPPGPSERTVKEYVRKVDQILSRAKEAKDTLEAIISEVNNTSRTSTCTSRRAAVLWAIRSLMSRSLAKQDGMQRTNREAEAAGEAADWTPWRKVVSGLATLVIWHTRVQGEGRLPIGGRCRRHSKRQDMKCLPEDWRERMVNCLPKYRLAVLVQAVTGCRPDELAKGVQLSIAGDQLVVTITGSKVTKTSEQPVRRLKWDLNSDVELVQMLVAAVSEGVIEARIAHPKT